MSALRDAALAYANHGWAVFPLSPKSKLPAISKAAGGRGCLDATCDEATIRRWWTMWPNANIGLATGTASGLFVLDVDPLKGGNETLTKLEAQNGLLPGTIVSLTGSDGRHFLFRHVEGIKNSVSKLGPGLDIRSDGGYIVAPPSIHPKSGKAYAWYTSGATDRSVAEAPPWLVALAMADVTPAAMPVSDAPAAANRFQQLFSRGADEGGRNDTATRLAGHLLTRGRLNALLVLDIMKLWNEHRCRPPLSDAEIVSVVDSVCGRQLAKMERRRRS